LNNALIEEQEQTIFLLEVAAIFFLGHR